MNKDDENADVEQQYNDWWQSLADGFVHPMASHSLLDNLVNENNLTGGYCEAWLRSLVKQMVTPRYKVSTGGIIRASDRRMGRMNNQCDIIIWDPSEIPSPLEVDDFALVPAFSVRGIIEVKRTYGSPTELKNQVKERQKAIISKSFEKYALGVVVKNSTSPFEGEVRQDWIEDTEKGEPRLIRLLDDNNKADLDGVMSLICMLSHLCGHRGQVAK